jgi:hypothetical protein
MHTLGRMSDTIRPVLTEARLGSAGWQVILEDAARLGRRPNRQALALIHYALKHRLAGRNVELTSSELDRLLGRSQLETVA